MRQAGELVHWNDARGFGFIKARDGQVFVHVSQIGRIANRPRIGDRLSFTTRLGRDGRLEAVDVQIANANPMPSRAVLQRGMPQPRRRLGWQMAMAFALAGFLMVALVSGHAPLWLGGIYLGMGALSFSLYRSDKHSAESGAWRTSEATLLGVDLSGGIIGGLLAQSLLRHKSRKPSYVATTLLLAGIHLLWLGGFAMGLIDSADFAALARLA